jgi:hypothetical protein
MEKLPSMAFDGPSAALYIRRYMYPAQGIYNVYTIVDIYRDAYWCGPQRATTVPSQRGAKPSP